MFFDSNFFWFLMGIVFVLVAAGFRAYAKDRGWVIAWWKVALGIVWYGILMLSFYAWGTLIGEREGDAGMKILLLGLVFCLVTGAGLLKLMAAKKQ